MKKNNFANKQKTTLQLFGRVSGLGITFAIIICMGTFAGYKADIFFSSKPVLTCIGTISGFIIALISIYKIIEKDIL
ncbi:AtpZ/AtpI family protein [Pectinatus sottacetonis]|uniref:AtpZ/AtpI family protein n=1 Tax=Pectinatus sottacetonis TaxID=1002795 RepID=UPI0018C684C1|nr:AtpZ/AtpI family protein [Pectinatus sottacetonis]